MKPSDAVLTAAEREHWAYSDADLEAAIDRLWHAYGDAGDATLPPAQMRAVLATLADGAHRMIDDFWAEASAHAA